MKTYFRTGIFVFVLSLFSIAIILAQGIGCPELVTEALLTADEACSETGRNEACYGYNQVEASFAVTVADDFFSSPSNISPIADIAMIRTSPLNLESGVWGVAVMNIQADLPNTIPGQNVTFILLGDVEIENAVAPEDAFQASDGIEVSIASAAGANVRSGPGTNFNVVGGLRDGTTVLADGLSEDGAWLRIAYQNRPAWISLSVVNDDDPALGDLPTLTADLRTPMQAFYLRTGIGQTACEEAPSDSLLVQGPENIEITINVNGANIRLGSSGTLRVIFVDEEPFLEISVFDGEFEVGDTTIRRGHRSIVCLGDADSRGLDGENNDLVVTCDPSDPEPFDTGDWCNLESLPASLLNYEIDVPCSDDAPAPTTDGQTGASGSDSQNVDVDCSNFSIITQTIPATDFTLSWTEATGADSYEVAVYDSSGFPISSTTTSSTSISLNGGTTFSPAGYVDLRAYRGGVYACYTRLNFTRASDPNFVPLPEGTDEP